MELCDSDDDESVSSTDSFATDDEVLTLLSESSARFQQTLLWYWWEAPDDEEERSIKKRYHRQPKGTYSIIDEAMEDENGYILVREMTFDRFRSKLVTHFDIAFKRREIKWPKRNRQVQPMI